MPSGQSETRTWDAVLTTTLANYRNELYDNIFDVYPFLSWLNGSLGAEMTKNKRRNSDVKRMLDGGESIVEQLMYGTNGTATSYSGAESLDVSLTEGMTIARFNWKQYAASISITGLDKAVNQGKSQMINLLKGKTKQSEMSLRSTLSTDAFGDGTGNGSKALTGLATIVSTSTTLGGLAPGTYAWWKASTSSVGSWAANGRSKIRTLTNTLTYGADAPDVAFTDQTSFEYIQSAEEVKERYMINDSSYLNLGVKAVSYNGMPIIFDRTCTSGTMYLLNSNYLHLNVHKDFDMVTGAFQTPVGQDVSTAMILFYGNLSTSNRRMLGSLTGITA